MKKCISAEETAVFCQQVLLFLQTDLSMEEGITALCEGMKRESKYFRKIQSSYAKSGTLHSALEATGIFPEYMVGMIKLGEETNNLEKTLESLIAFYERENNLYKLIHRAVSYPILLMIIMVCVIGILIKFMLPVFSQMFFNLEGQIAEGDMLILEKGIAVGSVTIVISSIIIFLLFVVFLMNRTDAGRAYLREITVKMPFFKKIGYNMEIARFFESLEIILDDGNEISAAAERAAEIVREKKTREKFDKCVELIKNGDPFDKALEKTELLSGLHRRMIKAGELSEKLSSVSKKMSGIYFEMAMEQIERSVAAAEPMIIAVLSLVTGMILLSVMIPLINITLNL
ncbi:MAG: type II secretion system F family protein [Firmicutes bacterium]|nr:type II secretion system F family protein [Bacillota bacterium]